MPAEPQIVTDISVRRADPREDRDRVLAVLARNLAPASSPARYDWLYLTNPDGPALVWLAEDAGGEPVGTSAAHPRRMRVRGEVVQALNLSDFAIDAHYRALGPALSLLKATLEPVREGRFAFSYDYPSEAMHALYQRMGGVDLGPVERRVRPVDLSAIGRRKAGVLGGLVGAAGDVARRAKEALEGLPRDVAVEPWSGPCDARFDQLDQRLRALCPVVGVRDARYLNWRYLAHATWDHTLLCATRADALVGWAAVREQEAGLLHVVDLFSDDAGVRKALAAAAADLARERGLEALDVQVLAGSATARMADALGFVVRGTGVGPVPFAPADGPHASTLRDRDAWWAMGGDRDI